MAVTFTFCQDLWSDLHVFGHVLSSQPLREPSLKLVDSSREVSDFHEF